MYRQVLKRGWKPLAKFPKCGYTNNIIYNDILFELLLLIFYISVQVSDLYRSTFPRKSPILLDLFLTATFSYISCSLNVVIQARERMAVRCVFLYDASFQFTRSCVKTLQESFKSLTIIATAHKTDTRVDGTIRVSHKVGDIDIEQKATIKASPGQSKIVKGQCSRVSNTVQTPLMARR